MFKLQEKFLFGDDEPKWYNVDNFKFQEDAYERMEFLEVENPDYEYRIIEVEE